MVDSKRDDLAVRNEHAESVSHDGRMRITYDPEADAAYIYLTNVQLGRGRESIELESPPVSAGTVVMDWKDGKIVGLEIINASALLHSDLIEQAEPPSDH